MRSGLPWQRAVPKHLRTCHLGAATRTQFNCVDYGTNRDVAQRQVVARLDVSVRTSLDEVTLGQLVRSDDVTLGAINVVQECDASRAVRVVLDFGNAGVMPSLS